MKRIICSIFFVLTSVCFANNNPQTLEEKVSALKEYFGERICNIPEYYRYELLGVQSLRTQRPSNTTDPNALEVSDFSVGEIGGKVKIISSDSVRSTLLNKYPQNWVLGEVYCVKQNNDMSFFAEARFVDPFKIISNRRFSDITIESVIFYGSTTRMPYGFTIERCMAHEISHGNDWESDNNLLFEERVDFALAIISRVLSDDRFESGYIEQIRGAYEDSSLCTPGLVYKLANEYWAELCAEYFYGNRSTIPQKDLDIIENIIFKNDPSYTN